MRIGFDIRPYEYLLYPAVGYVYWATAEPAAIARIDRSKERNHDRQRDSTVD